MLYEVNLLDDQASDLSATEAGLSDWLLAQSKLSKPPDWHTPEFDNVAFEKSVLATWRRTETIAWSIIFTIFLTLVIYQAMGGQGGLQNGGHLIVIMPST